MSQQSNELPSHQTSKSALEHILQERAHHHEDMQHRHEIEQQYYELTPRENIRESPSLKMEGGSESNSN